MKMNCAVDLSHTSRSLVVRANDWNTTTHIQDYIKEKGLKSNNELQAVFTRRMIATIQKFGKTPIGTTSS